MLNVPKDFSATIKGNFRQFLQVLQVLNVKRELSPFCVIQLRTHPLPHAEFQYMARFVKHDAIYIQHLLEDVVVVDQAPQMFSFTPSITNDVLHNASW